jgi:antitoxin HicB
MARKNPHIGSGFESWLDDAGIREDFTAAAIKAVIARQRASEMKKKDRQAADGRTDEN